MTFAWFTSKDEVTNRLSASADYGVSIVESFAPPKNWIPGQTVNKDVYAVNTGNIDAFVKTDVSGVINLTYENLSTTFDATKAVKLTLDQVKAINGQTTEDGFKTYEAGGWLAWAKADDSTKTIDVGSINEGRTQDIAEPWTPTENGIYVFRRAINKVSENNPFTYSGYYYKDGEYYKINLGDDTFPAERKEVGAGTGAHVDYIFDIYAESTDLFGANATDENFIDQKTGTIKSPVNYMYVVEEKVTDADVDFTFDAAKKRLIAEYEIPATTPGGASGTYDAKAEAARAQVAYENARAAYDAAVASYNNAVANKTYGSALATAEQALYNAKVALEDKYNDAHGSSGTEGTWTTAQTDANKAANYLDTTAGTKPTSFSDNGTRSENAVAGLNDLSDGITALAPTTIMPSEFYEALNGTGTPEGNQYVAALNAQDSALRAAYNNYVAIYQEIYGTDGSGNTNGLYKDVTTLLTTIKDNTDESDTGHAADAKAASATLETKAGTLKNKMDALRAAYTDLKNATQLATGLDLGATNDLLANLTGMQTVAENFKTNAKELDDLVDALVTAENNYVEDKNDLNEEIETWKKAVDKYNTDVTTAKTAYNVVNATDGIESAKEKNDAANAWDNNNTKHVFEDKSPTVVPKYSAISTTGGDNPVIGESDVTKLKNYTGNSSTWSTLGLSNGVNIHKIDEDVPADGITDELEENDFTTNNLIQIPDDERAGTSAQKTIAEWEALINTNGYKKALEEAKAAYDTAKANSSTGHSVKFYVNLNPEYATDWQIDAQDQDEAKSFDFYYKWVLAAGETSKSKLIDSVAFDSEIEAGAYKYLTFDLNVGLDSVQVTYDDSQNLYKTDAVDASFDFKLKVVNPTEAFDASQALTWG